jgi:hypothetical protein
VEVTVTQDSKEPDLSLKVGQSVDDGIGMIFWVDPSDKMVGKAVSVKRQGGNPFEASVMSHNALSTVQRIQPRLVVDANVFTFIDDFRFRRTACFQSDWNRSIQMSLIERECVCRAHFFSR